MQKTLDFLYYPFTMEQPLLLLLYGIDTPHDPEFVVDRPGPRQDWIILCFRTPFLMATDSGTRVGQVGDCIVHDANSLEWHTTAPGEVEGFRNDWLHVAPAGMQERANRYGIQLNNTIPTGIASFLSEHLRVIADEDRHRNAFWEERIATELEVLLLRLARVQATLNTQDGLTVTERSHLGDFSSIRSVMLDRFHENWSVKRLADMTHMSPNRFSVLYQLFFKISPIEELIQHRLKQSCTMLVYSNANLEGIAETCGFTDASYYSRVFKERMGCSPGMYRKLGLPRVA
jgi:AraC family transcriptional regulator, arabinose operon regulatory protein